MLHDSTAMVQMCPQVNYTASHDNHEGLSYLLVVVSEGIS